MGAERRRALIGMAVAVAVIGGVVASPLWAALHAAIVGLDFDPTRADLLAAWVACMALAALAGALSGRPWPSVLLATVALAATYAGPWAWSAATDPPELLGSAEQLEAVALAGQVAVILGVGFLLATPMAAGGQLVAAALVGAVRAVRDRSSRWSAAVAGALVVAAAAAVAGGVSLVRYGPTNGLYVPATAGPVPAGQVLLRTFHSAAMGEDRPYAIYLPPGYAANPTRRYPVVYLLHGDPGTYRDWVNLGIARLLDTAIASRSVPPMIAVMPDGNGVVPGASQWADAWDGRDNVEDSVLELVSVVDQGYRTLADRQHRLVAGLSEGGFGAANLAAQHPAVFGVAISLSGYFTAQGPVFGTNPAYVRANSPAQVLQAPGPARSVEYVLAVGAEDPRYRRATEAFAQELDRLGVHHQLYLLPGGHQGTVWTGGLLAGLEQLRPQLASTAP